jgi:hypothetical protein
MRVFPALMAVCLSFSCFSCRDQVRSGEVGIFKMGERAQIGPLIYSVLDTQWSIGIGEGPMARIPSNRFLMVNVSVVNSGGKEDATVPTFTLIDEAGKGYPELDNGEGVKDWMGFIRKIRPAESAQGLILFDVPQKAFKLRVADDGDQHYGYITIPLSLGDGAPTSIPMPKGPGQ